MATQKAVQEYLKKWQEATSFKEAAVAAVNAAREYDGLYEESAKNLLARTPDLMLLLSAYVAGKKDGVMEERAKHPDQGTLPVGEAADV